MDADPPARQVDGPDKRLNEMNRLGDMLHFPAVVNAGATANVMLTVALTWWVEPRHPAMAGAWTALILAINLLPVLLLRLSLTPETPYPRLREMNFFTDQHKFSDWVYLAASADMAFWILLTWTVAALRHDAVPLIALEVLAFLVTFSPVLLRAKLR